MKSFIRRQNGVNDRNNPKEKEKKIKDKAANVTHLTKTHTSTNCVAACLSQPNMGESALLEHSYQLSGLNGQRRTWTKTG